MNQSPPASTAPTPTPETVQVPKAEWDALVEASKRTDLRSVDAAVHLATCAVSLLVAARTVQP